MFLKYSITVWSLTDMCDRVIVVSLGKLHGISFISLLLFNVLTVVFSFYEASVSPVCAICCQILIIPLQYTNVTRYLFFKKSISINDKHLFNDRIMVSNYLCYILFLLFLSCCCKASAFIDIEA